MIYTLFSQLLPNRDGEIRCVMGHETYTTLEEAEAAHRKQRMQNLPLRSWVVSFPDPREG